MKKIITTVTIAFCCHTNAQNINTYAGTGTAGWTGNNGQSTSAEVNAPRGMIFDATGNLYFADYMTNVIRKIDLTGVVTAFCGTSNSGFSGDGGAATAAYLKNPWGITSDPAGNFYISDCGNQRIRKINTSGIITTICGTGTAGAFGNGGAATAAYVSSPMGLAFNSGNLYICDNLNNSVRRINSVGVIDTFFNVAKPAGICFDQSGNAYISTINNFVYKVTPAGVRTIIGGGAATEVDGVAATSSLIFQPYGIAIDNSGNVYVSDRQDKIRIINASGIINTIAGTGTVGFSGDGGAATAAELNGSYAVAISPTGNLYLEDEGNHRIRVVCLNLPTLNITGTTSICDGQSTSLTAAGAYTYSWSTSATTQTVSLNPTATASYTTIGSSQGCSSSKITTVTVNPLPVVSFSSLGFSDSICSNLGAQALTGATPTGGTYSGTGVSSGNFNPSVGVGTYTITYSYTNGNGCTNNATHDVVVKTCAAGIETIASKNIKMYPNPTKGIVNFEGIDKVILNVYDTNGKLVQQSQGNLDISNQMNGLYQVIIQVGSEIYFTRIMKE